MTILCFRIVLLSLAVSAAWSQQPPVRSPEVTPGGMVTFRLNAPKATDVTVSGEFMKGTKAFQKDENGVWSVTVGPIEPEIYYYNFTIDGVRTIDPHNPDVKTGSTPSTISSVLEVKGSSPAIYDGQSVPHGEIRTNWYESKSLKTLRRLTVYTPPGYDADTQTRYPVLYLFHGANADETAWTRLGHVNLILDNLLASRRAKPFVVVMPFGYGVPPGTQGNDVAFSRDLTEDVIPFVQSRYRVSTDRAQRAIFGLSMGGGQSLSIGLSHLDLFSYIGGFSSGLRPADFAKTFASVVSNPRAFSEFLKEHKIKHTFRESEGAHTWMVWRRYLHEVAPMLFQEAQTADLEHLPGNGLEQ